MAKVKFKRSHSHVHISEIPVKNHDADYEKRYIEHMKETIDSGSKKYPTTSKDSFDMYDCPEIKIKEEH